MKSERQFAVRVIGLALCCLAMISCQTSTESTPVESGPMIATVRFGVSVDHYPDSADWSSSKQSGTGGLTCAAGYCTDTLRLRDALGSDTAKLRLWSFGIRIATLKLSQNGRSTSLAYTSIKDSFEIRILDDFLEFKQNHSDSFANIGPIGASNLVTFYAAQVLSGRPGYNGFPTVLPVGMKTDSVKRAIVALGPAFALTSSKLAGLGLGLDSASIRVFAAELIAKGKLSANDTMALFPRAQVRVLMPLSVSGEVVPGGAGVAVSGSFSWNKGRIVSAPTITVRTATGVDPLFSSSAKKWPTSADTSWSLSDNVKLSAPLSATPGMDTLSVILSTDSGYSIEARAIFRVLPRDVLPPELRISRPGKDTAVPNETYSAVVEAIASDSNGIDSVRIRNKTLTVAPYLDTVFLAVGENQVVAQAWDRYGNSSYDTVRISRAKPVGDTTPPKIIRISPVADTSVPWSTKSLALSWAITDDSPLQRVALDSVVMSGTSGHFLSQVSLPVGSKTFVLVATDTKGNTRIDSVRILRKSDTVKPEIRFVSPGADTSVPYPVGRIRVVVAAEDAESGLDSVKIGATKFIASPFADTVDLSTGANRIVIQAWDKAGIRTERVLLIERGFSSGDSTAPVIKRSSPSKDTAVAWSTKSFPLSYSITDDSLLSRVWLNDTLWTGTLDSYQRTVNLSVGTNVFRVAAQDAHGNRRLDTLRIVRASDTVPSVFVPVDSTAPVIKRSSPSKDTAVSWSTKSFSLSYSITDDSLLSKVWLNDTLWTGTLDVYQRSVGLSVGTNVFRVAAQDARGNRRQDTLRIVRDSDTVPPVFVSISPSKDSGVAAGIGAILVSAKASDANGIDSIRIGTKTHTSDAASDSITLSTGINKITVQVWDKAGLRTERVILIDRAFSPGDTTLPVIKRGNPSKDTAVAWSTKSFPLTYSITDDSLLSKVWLNDTLWTGTLDVYQRSVGLSVGTNVFRVAAQDLHGNRRLDTVRIVRAADALPPVLEFAGPSKDTSVAHGIGKILVSAKGTDANGIDSIRIGSITHKSDAASDSITLATGINKITVQVWDKAGNRTERILAVERRPSPGDTIAPVIKRSNPSKDTAVAWSTKSFPLTYSITDDSLLSKVWLNDTLWTGNLGTYQRSVGLAVGTNTFRVAAQDLHGNRRLDTVRIVRAADALAPVLEFAGPSKDSSVAFNVGTILVSVNATDANGIDSIRIGTTTRTTAAASASVALVTGINKIPVQAWDKAGNRTVDTLRITRARDNELPKIVRATGASSQVLSYPSSSNISWTVTDNDALSTVTIQGVAAQGSLNVYTASVPVLPGRFYIVVVATDRTGNISTDTVWWTGQLYDSRDRKSYRIATMPDGKVWMAEDLAKTPTSCVNSCVDSFFTWSQAMDLPDDCDGAVCDVDTTVAIKGICPTGWHLPTASEWKNLVTKAGIVHLKSATAWIKNSNGIITDYNGDDLYGFNLLPRSPDCSAGGCSMAGKWWTTYQVAESNAGDFQVSLDASWQSRGKWLYMNVRCVRN